MQTSKHKQNLLVIIFEISIFETLFFTYFVFWIDLKLGYTIFLDLYNLHYLLSETRLPKNLIKSWR